MNYLSCSLLSSSFTLFFFNNTATTEIYTLSLHDALPIFLPELHSLTAAACRAVAVGSSQVKRSEEHTSELQSQFHLVCRLLLEKKKDILQNGLINTMSTSIVSDTKIA